MMMMMMMMMMNEIKCLYLIVACTGHASDESAVLRRTGRRLCGTDRWSIIHPATMTIVIVITDADDDDQTLVHADVVLQNSRPSAAKFDLAAAGGGLNVTPAAGSD